MPKVVDHDAYRSKLLHDSFAIAAEVGYGSLSMKQLAKCLKISTGLIYHYFESKEDWFVSLVAHYGGEVVEGLIRDVPVDAPVAEKAELLLRHIERHKEIFHNMISVASDYVRMPGAAARVGANELALLAERLNTFGAALFETDERTARALFSHVIGVIVTNRLDPKGFDVMEHVTYLRAMLERDTMRLPAETSA